VKEMQEDLILLGFDCGKWGADGDFGDATEMAVKDFQKSFGLTVDGIFGPASYDMMCKALAAIDKVAKDFTVGNIFFVWLQGESDAIEGNGKRYYMEKLTELAGALKTDVGIERFGIIRVGRFTNDQRDLEIIDAQDEICKENGFFLMLTRIATELNLCVRYMNPDVKGHYSAEGLIKLGDEAARTLAAFVTE
jgi:hypothetical protein